MSQAEPPLSPSRRTNPTHSKRQHELPHLNRKLIAYAAAAGAAGVSLLALSQRGEAEIIFTRAHHVITNPLPIDVNNDGITDFNIVITNHVSGDRPLFGATYFSYLLLSANTGNSFVESANNFFAEAMQRGQKIGEPPAVFHGGRGVMDFWTLYYNETGFFCFGTSGPWHDVGPRYLGLKFMIDGQPHYGWARLHIGAQCFRDGISRITGYAYETEPNVHLRAGQMSENEVSEDGSAQDEGQADAKGGQKEGWLGWLAAGMAAQTKK